ncbi:MAG: hypothetical protein ACXVDD_25720 [Polyangia bacterium]
MSGQPDIERMNFRATVRFAVDDEPARPLLLRLVAVREASEGEDTMDDHSTAKKQRIVYQIIEKPGMKKAHWMKVGIAHLNQDQSINIYLDAIPYERKLQIREEEVRPRQVGDDKREPAMARPTYDLGGSIQ